MITHPTADELLGAVAAFIERVAPDLKDRDVFLARVAVNAVNVVRRELEGGGPAHDGATERLSRLLDQAGDFPALNAALATAIQGGGFDHREAELLAHLKQSAVDQVRIDQPGYSGLKAAFATEPSEALKANPS